MNPPNIGSDTILEIVVRHGDHLTVRSGEGEFVYFFDNDREFHASFARPRTSIARNDQLAQFFHRNLGDILLSLNEPAKAVPHFRIALEKNKNSGYVEEIESALARAVEQSGQ